MKTRIYIFTIVSLLSWNVSAQTAGDWINQGYAYLAASNIVNANASFSNALALKPKLPIANALYAITRLLVLPSQPTGSNFLTRIGFPADGRSIYKWTSYLPTNSDGLLLAPADVNANEFTAQLRTNVLAEVFGAISNLAVITDTNFLLFLSSSETKIYDVTVDYGDIKLIQSGLYGAEYSIYLLNSQNFDAQLTALYSLYTNKAFSIERVLTDYPQLFTFATTNDLQAASAAFTNAVDTYLVASAFIRARPTNEIRLFNLDQNLAQYEADFSSVLQDLESSLAGARVLGLDTNLVVNLERQFDGSTTWRSLLPKFDGNAIELGSLPDLTFGGMIDGLTPEEIESFLGRRFTMLPVGSAPWLSDGMPELAFTTLRGHYYALEASTNLADWQVLADFTATNAVSVWLDSHAAAMSMRFYRLRDNTGFLAFSGVVLDQNTELPVAGAQVRSLYDSATTFTDANGQFFLQTSLPVSWYSDELEISATGYITIDNYYGGNGLVSGLEIYLSPPPANDGFSNRMILTGTNLIVTGSNVGTSQESGEPNPTGDAAGQSVWWSWTAPANGILQIDATTSSFWPLIEIFTGNNLSSLNAITNNGGSIAFQVTAGTTYQIALDGYQDDYPSSGTIEFSLNFIAAPANDDFANRTVLTGSGISTNGNNSGASYESGDPYPVYYGKSVWYSWTAPTSEFYTLSVSSSFNYPVIAVFTGTQLSTLLLVNYDFYYYYYAGLSISATEGQTYQIAIDDENESGGTYTLTIAPSP